MPDIKVGISVKPGTTGASRATGTRGLCQSPSVLIPDTNIMDTLPKSLARTRASHTRSASQRLKVTGWSLVVLPMLLAASEPASSQPAASQPSTQPATVISHTDAAPGGNAPDGHTNDLTGLSLEDLMNVEVTSVSRQKQKASETAAAVTVISQDDIARSGLSSVPELLRLVPGMDVARLNAGTWAISTRGFNDAYANKLLVLSDGRSIYSPLFSGVFWSMQQPLLQDLDRIEVIRGPGATIWGSNAVNGVINITSKPARDTQGLLVTGMGGNYEQVGGARFGGQIDDKTYFRITAKYQNTYNFPLSNGRDGHDGWQGVDGSFRIDRYATTADTFTLQGGVTRTREAQTILLPSFMPPAFMTPSSSSFNSTGVNLLGRWTHVVSDTSDFSLQVYYDRLDRPGSLSPYRIDIGDIEFHHRFALGERQEIIYGAEYRYWADQYDTSPLVIAMRPRRRNDYLASAFIQDDLTILPDRFHLIAGTKIEQNSSSGFEVQPSARALWTPSERHTVWGAVSRAVRTPARWEQDATIVSAPVAIPGLPFPAQPVVFGTRNFNSEELTAYELGYRVRPAPRLSVDTAIFYNAYDKLRGYELGTPSFAATPVPHLGQPVFVSNSFSAESLGVEIAGNWQVNERWRWAGSYSFLNTRVHTMTPPNPSNTPVRKLYEHSSPRHQAQVHSYLDITRNLQLNAGIYFVDTLSALNVPLFIRTDVGLTWTPRKNLELTIGVQNLFDNHHPEFVGTSTTFAANTEVPRTVYGQIVFRY